MWSKVINAFKLKEDLPLLLITFTIPCYFIVDANNQFLGLIPLAGSLQILVYLIVGALSIFLLLCYFINPNKATILLSTYLTWYLYFKTIQVKLVSIHILSIFSNLSYFLGCTIVLLMLITVIVFFLRESRVKKMSKYLNLLFIIFLITEVGKMWLQLIYENPRHYNTNQLEFKAITSQIRPDIYLLVMDEYAGFQSSETNFNYNNQEFVNKLRADNFFVANSPNSNYNSTLFSLASMFNLNYSNSFIEKNLKDISAFGQAAKEIQYNILVPFLISRGYIIKNYSGFRIESIPSGAFYFMAIENRLALEKTFGNVLKNELFSRLPSNSLQRFLGTQIAQVDEYNQAVYRKCKKEFSKDSNMNPKFVYAHFFMPHEPLLYSKDGKVRKYSDVFLDKRMGTYKKSYAEYLQYTNSQISTLINLILNKKGDKIVLLVSDHGERFTKGTTKGSEYNNFFAVYNSQKKYNSFSDTFPLINTFRVILNDYFNQELPMLENKKFNVYNGKKELF